MLYYLDSNMSFMRSKGNRLFSSVLGITSLLWKMPGTVS